MNTGIYKTITNTQKPKAVLKQNKYYILLIMLILAACSKQVTGKEGNVTINVKTAVATDTLFTPVKEYNGTIYASQEANLGSVVPGRVERILIPEGGYVSAGAKVVEMSDELLAQARVEYETLAKDLQRVQTLLERSTVSQQEYDHVKARYDAAKAKFEMIKKNTEIRAPFSGTVVKHIVHEGENYSFLPNINPGYSMSSGIVSLMQLDPLIVKTEVNEQDLQYIKTGQKVKIKLKWEENQDVYGVVQKIMPVLSTATRTATMEVKLSNPGRKLKPGMFCTLAFQLPAKQGIAIARECLMLTPGTAEHYVYTIEAGKAKRQVINILADENVKYIVEGITSGTSVAAEGKSKLSDGAAVQAK